MKMNFDLKGLEKFLQNYKFIIENYRIITDFIIG